MAKALITVMQIILFIVCVRLIWIKLEVFTKKEKIIMCIIGMIISFIITNIIFLISSSGINYENAEIKNKVSFTINTIFTPINGIIFMPYIAKFLSKIRSSEIKSKQANKKIMILCIIFFIIAFIEIKYFNYMQLGALDIANKI